MQPPSVAGHYERPTHDIVLPKAENVKSMPVTSFAVNPFAPVLSTGARNLKIGNKTPAKKWPTVGAKKVTSGSSSNASASARKRRSRKSRKTRRSRR